MTILYLSIPVAAIAAAVLLSVKSLKKHGAKKALLIHFAVLCVMFSLCLGGSMAVAAAETDSADPALAAETEAAGQGGLAEGLKYIGAALATGLAGIGGGLAVASAAPAAIGATSEDPKAFGKALIFVALGEAIALYGVIISVLVLFS